MVNPAVQDAMAALTERFLAAVAVAEDIHGRQRRTGTEIPYMAHLLVVCGLTIEDGGDEDQAITALLHDSVEDGGGRPVLERIERSFGSRVASMVEELSDSIDGDADEPWIERKRSYLEHLPEVTDEGVLRVALADKVHNARSLVRDYRNEGHALWERFTQKTARDQLWYYGGLAGFFQVRRPGGLTEDLVRAVRELAWLVAQDDARRASHVRLWLDPDLHGSLAPDGWIQVLTALEAIQLLEEQDVTALSVGDPRAGHAVIEWLIRTAERDPDRWPAEISMHGDGSEEDLTSLADVLDGTAQLRRTALRKWSRV
jgi:hypothetical protein